MAHYEKFDKNSIAKQFNHDNRSNTDKRDRIDKKRSYLNYNLCNVENPIEYNKELIEMIKAQGGRIRKDSIYMCSLIITLPKDFPDSEELEKQFFKSAKRYLDKIHGKDNCLSAWVHRDEAQSHMHYRFCPIKYDDEKSRYKLCAKEILNRNFLKSFHNNLEKEMEEELGFKVSILNGATKDGHKEINELIAITEAKEELEKIKNSYSLSEKENELFNLKEKEIQRKKLVNDFWKEYQEISKNYWKNYKLAKQNINNDIFEIKRNVKSAEYQLSKDLDFFNNLNRGLLFAIVRLFVALMTYHIKDDLNAQIRQLEGELEELDKQRRSCSSYQNSSKIALKSEDLERIENSLQKWENSVRISENVIKSYFEKSNSTLKNFVRNKEKEEERF